MPGQLSRLLGSLRSVLSGFTTGQKAVTGLALAGLLAAGLFFAMWASRPALVPLFTNLASSDAAAITEELIARGTAYELDAGGTSILVPQQDVYQLRLDLSAAGLPQDGESGYELLDEQGITTSEFRQRVDYQRALEGELSKTISSIDGVEATTVHLVMPEENLFSEDDRQPTASVLVKNRPGKTMNAQQVQAVVNLVSSSVEGLDQSKVTVADSTGKVLSTLGEDGASMAAGDARATQTASYEQDMQRSIEEMLAPLVGPGGAVVSVNADLDFDRRETMTEEFETDKQAPVVSERTGTEDYLGAGQVVGGVLGPENLTLPEGGDTTYTKDQVERDYAVGKVTEKAVSAPGAVQRMSVAVALDADAEIPTGDVEQLVAAAAGIDPARGDVVEVSRLAFDQTAADAAAEEFAKMEAAEASKQRWALIRTVAVLLVVGLLLLYGMRVLRRDRRTPVELPVLELETARNNAIGAEEAAMLAAAEQLALESPEERAAKARRSAVHHEVTDLVDRQPEEVAQLLRGWLADRRS